MHQWLGKAAVLRNARDRYETASRKGAAAVVLRRRGELRGGWKLAAVELRARESPPISAYLLRRASPHAGPPAAAAAAWAAAGAR